DFALDGTNRLFMASPSAVHEVNTTTGAVAASFGSLPTSSSSLAAIPSRTILRVSQASIGQVATISIVNGPPNGIYGLYLSLGTNWALYPPSGVLRIDPNSFFFFNLVTSNFNAV